MKFYLFYLFKAMYFYAILTYNIFIYFLNCVIELEDSNFGNNTMAVVPLKANPSNGNGHWSAYVMATDDVGLDVISIRVNYFYFLISEKFYFSLFISYGVMYIWM